MLGKRGRLFVDADAFVSLSNKEDRNYKKALKLSKLVKERKTEVLTSSFAIGEAITVISQKVGLDKAVAFGINAYKGELIILDASRLQQLKALKRFSQQRSKNVRFTDFVNMVLMDELKIKTIFSFDRHYKKEGYKLYGGLS